VNFLIQFSPICRPLTSTAWCGPHPPHSLATPLRERGTGEEGREEEGLVIVPQLLTPSTACGQRYDDVISIIKIAAAKSQIYFGSRFKVKYIC